ncbi:aldo/keto reductase [Patulibacter sp. SYSU D01012]|uniref:aldo/keto reductase n=1 Tax=Patulibacter sp. SYSU D01012 TaxID=2817381 RepID=UPI001B3067D6|nr:aldo/keto reductase [Patulibacter sp. SYSU D01012]
MTALSPAVPTVALNDGRTTPQLGYGVFQIPEDATEAAVLAALEAGYRHLDTAAIYGNEAAVGRAIAASGVPRDELFVTTKLWIDGHGREEAPRAFAASLDRLGLDHVDLYLIHWPVPATDRYVETWRALADLRADGRARSTGVSNFTSAQLARVIDETGVVPAVNQVELHPLLPQDEVRAANAARGVVTQAWSPLAQGRLDGDPTVARIAAKHGVAPALVLLRWNLDQGNVVLTKSATPARIRQNLDALTLALDAEDAAALAGLATGERGGPDPETFAG